jgi:hypothetical protein
MKIYYPIPILSIRIDQFANNRITIPKITKKAKRYLRIIKNLYFCHSINIVVCLSVVKHNNLNFLL